VTGGVELGTPCAEFVEAMDDDLSLPAALAALQGVLREGHKLLADGASDALRGSLASVRAMLDILGLDPLSPVWHGRNGGGAEHAALDSLVHALIEQRARAREERDFATADAVRDRLKEAGIAVEDTPSGPRWSVEGG